MYRQNESIEWCQREKNTFALCTTRWIMKKRSSEKRKISSERRRLVEKLHARGIEARKNFLRRRIIIRGYDNLWQVISSRCVRTRASTEAITTYSSSSMCWASTRGAVSLKSSETAGAIVEIIRASGMSKMWKIYKRNESVEWSMRKKNSFALYIIHWKRDPAKREKLAPRDVDSSRNCMLRREEIFREGASVRRYDL